MAMLADIIVCVIIYNQIADNAKTYVSTLIEQQGTIARKQVDSLFTHKYKDVFPIYSRCKSHYKKGKIKTLNNSMFEDFMNTAYTNPKLPNDATSTYHVALEDGNRGSIDDIKAYIRMDGRDNDGGPTGVQGLSYKGLWQTGWGLGVRENWDGGRYGRRIVEYIITPYAVSFRNNVFYSLDGYLSIDDILDNAYKYYTEDDQSDFKRNIVSNVESFINEPYIDNLYYRLEEEKRGEPYINKVSMYADYGTYMYNNLYYVFVKVYGRKMYELTLNKDYVEMIKAQYIAGKKNQITIVGYVSVGILAIIAILCIIGIYRETKENKKTLQKRILSKCNPKNYIKKYDGHLLNIANNIYSKALVTDINDNEEILKLASLAEAKLGVVLVYKSDIRALKKKCNPKRFMKPYNPQKVAIANELYTKLKQKKLSCAEYLEIKYKLSQLYEGEIIKMKHMSFSHVKMKREDGFIIIILIVASVIYYASRNEKNERVNDVKFNNSKEKTFKKTSDASEKTKALAIDESKKPVNRLNTGSTPYENSYAKNYKCPYNRCSGIKVTAPKESDIVVIIKRNNKEGKVISHGYIRAGETYQFDLPKGIYQTFFYYGSGWNPNKEMANGVIGGFIKDEVFSKDQPQEINNAVLSYVLQLHRDGNFSTQSSNKSEFFLSGSKSIK